MAFLENIVDFLRFGPSPISLILFLVSTILVFVGVGMQVWQKAVNLGTLEDKPLSWIEKTHPHVPSAKTVLTLNICAFSLLAVGLQSFQGVFPFNDPYQGLNLFTLFVLAAALGTLGELKWKGTKTYAYAFILGTAVGFLAVTALFSFPYKTPVERLLLTGLAFVAGSVSWHMLGSMKDRLKSGTLALVVCVFWILVYTLQ